MKAQNISNEIFQHAKFIGLVLVYFLVLLILSIFQLFLDRMLNLVCPNKVGRSHIYIYIYIYSGTTKHSKYDVNLCFCKTKIFFRNTYYVLFLHKGNTYLNMNYLFSDATNKGEKSRFISNRKTNNSPGGCKK